MASRYLLFYEKVEIDFPEDRIKKGNIKKFDILIDKTIGLECKSKRFTEMLDINKLDQDIQEKKEQFNQLCFDELGIELNVKALVFDITRNEYKKPNLLRELKNLQVPEEIDALVFTWKEKTEYEGTDLITIKYKIIGNIHDSFPALQFMRFKSGAITLRKYVEPEPQWAEPGQEESRIEWILAKHGGNLVRNELFKLTEMAPDDFSTMLNELEHNGKIEISGNRIKIAKKQMRS